MGKIKKTILISLIFTVLLFSFAAATVEFVSNDLTIAVDYHDFSSDTQDHLSKNVEIIVRNTDAEPINVTLSAENLPTDYSADDVSQTIEANTETSITFNIQIPHKEKNGETNIGYIVVKDDQNQELDRINIKQETLSMLEFKKWTVEYTNEDNSVEEDSFDTSGNEDEFSLAENVRTGSEITFMVELRNLFDRDYEEDYNFIEEITLSIDADDSDIFPNDFEEEYTFNDLDAREDGTLEISFIIDNAADAGDYKLEFTLEGEDGKGIQYKVKKTISIDLSRSRDDVRIDKTTLTPTTIELCPSNKALLDIELQNYGTRDQNLVELSLYSVKLGINEHVGDIQINKHTRSDDTWEKIFNIQLPEIIEPGTYPIEVRVFVNRDDLVDDKTISLTVKSCSTTPQIVEEPVIDEKEEEEEQEEVSMVAGLLNKLKGNENTEENKVEKNENFGEEGKIVYTIEDPYTTNDFIMAGLIMAVIIVLAFITLFIVILLKR